MVKVVSEQVRNYRGKPMWDGPDNFSARIMRRDIDKAEQRNPWTCAIAQSLMRNKRILSAKVGRDLVYIEFPDHWERYELTTEQARKVKTFDASSYFEPCVITLVPPRESKKIGYKKGKSGTNVRKGLAKTIHNSQSIPMRPHI